MALDIRSPPRPPSIGSPWDQRLARALLQPGVASRVTPNQLTTLSLAVGWLAAWLYAQGDAAVHLARCASSFRSGWIMPMASWRG